jgi:hypothetical protein
MAGALQELLTVGRAKIKKTRWQRCNRNAPWDRAAPRPDLRWPKNNCHVKESGIYSDH